ncbi:hypothetical protein [Sulfurimonas sp.]|uniref:hypothetical protein n=1 Tax=Sulfurimonas sp. TaxID=2022749 RepID=UPI002AAFFF0C|nr:hypothetical protein [Sulfurimonas sp.]
MNIKIIITALFTILLIAGCAIRVKYTPSLNIDKETAKQNIKELLMLQHRDYRVSNIKINNKQLIFILNDKKNIFISFKDIWSIQFLGKRGTYIINIQDKASRTRLVYMDIEKAKAMVNALSVMEYNAKKMINTKTGRVKKYAY